MKRGKPIILLLTVLLAALAVVFGRNEIGTRNFPFSVKIVSDETEEEIRCMKLDGEYYVFLPAYAQTAEAGICPNPIYDVFIDGQKVAWNQSCADFPVNTKLELYFRSWGNEGYETVTFVQSGNVATMYIHVPSGNMEYIHEQKGNEEPGWIRVYTKEGNLDYAGTLETLKGRGNATWMDDKKPYSLELSQEGNLLGLGAASRWILLSNAYDRSHLRNKMAYDMAKELDLAYSPDCTWTDLYLNGEYAGLYLLSERNEIHPQRVDLEPGSSFLVAVEPDWRLQEQGYPYVQTENGTAFRIHHSAMPDNAVEEIWQTAENAILAEDGRDPVTGKRWDELIDPDSWARKYLIEEILLNEDAGLASSYFYYDGAEGLIYAGPVWDMDVTMKETEQPWMSARAIMAGRPHLTHAGDRNYFYELLQKPEFRSLVETLYRTEFRPLLCRLLESGLEAYAGQTAQASAANQVRWNATDSVRKVQDLVDFLPKRMAYLDACWLHKQQMFLVQAVRQDRVGAFVVYPGETLEFLPDPENGVWYRMDTEEVLDRTLPVDCDMMLAVRELS